MIISKAFFYLTVATGMAIFSLSSCKNTSSSVPPMPPPITYKAPVSQPLTFAGTKKINWAALKKTVVHPPVGRFDINKLPAQNYDSAGFKPYKPVEDTTLDYNALPQSDLDIDKLPSKPIKFKTYILPPPRVIKAGLPRYKTANDQALFDFGAPEGLPGDIISCLYKDRSGFLWIATNQGVYRFDGENLLLYIPGPIDLYIVGIMQDDVGRIWLTALDNTIQVLDMATGLLKMTGKSLGYNGTVVRILQDKKQRIWLNSNYGGIDIIDPDLRHVRSLDRAHGLADTLAISLTKDKDQNIWISTRNGGVNIVDLKNKKIRHLDNSNGLKSNIPGSLFCDNQNRVWFGQVGGMITTFNIPKKTMQVIDRMAFPKSIIFGLSQDDKGRVWVGTNNNGLQIIDPEKGLIKQITERNGLNLNYVINMASDNQGQTWIGTVSGLNMIGNDHTTIRHIGNGATSTLTEDSKGFIWQGTNAGINIIDRKNNTSRMMNSRTGIANDTLETIREVDGKVLICSNSGLDIIDSARRTITHLNHKNGLNGNLVNAVSIDKQGRVWLGESSDGIDIYDPKKGTITHFGKNDGLGGKNVDDMAGDSQGHIWVALHKGGIVEIDPETFTIQFIAGNPAVNDVVGKILLVDKNDNVWVGTDKGIFIADRNAKTLTMVAGRQGLIDDKVTTLTQHENHVYVSTNKGVSAITLPAGGFVTAKSSLKIESYGLAYRILKKYNGFFLTDMVSKDGSYWWGDEGITQLNLVKQDTGRLNPFITGITIMSQPTHFSDRERFEANRSDTLWGPGDVHYLKGQKPENTGYETFPGEKWGTVSGPHNLPVGLELTYDQNFIQFQYGSLDLSRNEPASYRYVLVGADKQWSETTTDPYSKNYFNLNPGQYTFKVSRLNRNGLWSNPAQLSFTINPPWWLTWWAWILYLVLFSGTIYLFVYYRSLKLIKEKRVLEFEVHTRTQEVMQQKEEIEAQRDNLEQAVKDLKLTQSQLIQSEKLASLGELTAGIAHEIQNPLNFVNNFAEVSVELVNELKEEHGKEKREPELENELLKNLEQNLQKITQHGKRADGIVKNMLQHSRNNSSERHLTDINALADEYMRLSYHGLRAKDKNFNSAMVTHFDESLPKISIVPQDIGRVLLNLYNNAFYAVTHKKKTAGSDYKPEISVTTSATANNIIIRVRDNGNGIPDNIKDKIMQPFFTTKPTGEGTGLGLSLSYDMVVKGHGGTINIDSKEGEYTEFTILLPV